MFKAMMLAGLGGFIGTCLRFLTGKLAHVITVSAFPWGTFAVNVIGSFVIGIFFGLAEKTHVISNTDQICWDSDGNITALAFYRGYVDFSLHVLNDGFADRKP